MKVGRLYSFSDKISSLLSFSLHSFLIFPILLFSSSPSSNSSSLPLFPPSLPLSSTPLFSPSYLSSSPFLLLLFFFPFLFLLSSLALSLPQTFGVVKGLVQDFKIVIELHQCSFRIKTLDYDASLIYRASSMSARTLIQRNSVWIMRTVIFVSYQI